MEAPDAWIVHPNASFDVAEAQYPMDAFFGPGTVNGIQPNITIACLKSQTDQATTEQFRDGWRAFLQALVRVDVTPTLTSVSGSAAFAFDYRQDLGAGGSTIGEKTDVVFVHGQCRWLITLLVPSGLRGQYSGVFSSLLKSFKLLS